MAREFEEAGLTTVLVTAFPNVAENIGVNRIVKADNFNHPLGQPSLSLDDETKFRMKVLERCFAALGSEVKGPTVF